MASLKALAILALATALLAPAKSENLDYATIVDKFSGSLFQEASSQPDNKGKNFVQSGLSANMILSLVASAAEGQTKQELLNALKTENIEALSPSIRETMDKLNNVESVDLKLANKIFVRPSASGKLDSINPAFRARVEDSFRGEVQQVDFSKSSETARVINGWVEKRTNNLIKDLVDANSLTSQTAAVLINAVYFKGKWAKKFDARATKDKDFNLADGTTIRLPTLQQSGKFLFKDSKTLDSKVLLLPYQGNEFAFVAILPNKKNGLTDLEAKLSDGIKPFLEGLYDTDVVISLPKFKIESTIDIKAALAKLGVERLFSPVSELTGILNGHVGLTVSQSVQKATIEVNEDGAEAAAATTVIGILRSQRQNPLAEFRADHPFFFALVKKHDVELFRGSFRGIK